MISFRFRILESLEFLREACASTSYFSERYNRSGMFTAVHSMFRSNARYRHIIVDFWLQSQFYKLDRTADSRF